MGNKRNRYRKYQCPCCESYGLNEQAGNTFQLCPICYWEDDGVQSNDPEYEGGANKVSLNQGRINFKKYHVSDLKFQK